jgi:hypothetical protein
MYMTCIEAMDSHRARERAFVLSPYVVVYRGDVCCSLFGYWTSVYWTLAGPEQLSILVI